MKCAILVKLTTHTGSDLWRWIWFSVNNAHWVSKRVKYITCRTIRNPSLWQFLRWKGRLDVRGVYETGSRTEELFQAPPGMPAVPRQESRSSPGLWRDDRRSGKTLVRGSYQTMYPKWQKGRKYHSSVDGSLLSVYPKLPGCKEVA